MKKIKIIVTREEATELLINESVCNSVDLGGNTISFIKKLLLSGIITLKDIKEYCPLSLDIYNR